MNRRSFLKAAGLGGGVLSSAVFVPFASAFSVSPPKAPKPKSFVLDELTIPQLQDRLAKGKDSTVSLTRKYLARIKEIDRGGPCLNSVIELNPDALAIAAALDRQRKTGAPVGPLHGIPILIKDNIDTHDRMSTTAGSLALEGSVPLRDAFLIRRLRAAGAVILGKTNLSEWANFRGLFSTSGWSGRGGQTRNPYVLNRNPSGSSSGSAVAVSASLCAAAVGTETDGSILSPSSYNGVVGIKPTLGLISRSGIIPIAHSQDTAGPMARTVTDAAILLSVLVGSDPDDPAAAQAPPKRQDYLGCLDDTGLRGMRLGVARNFFGFHPQTDALMESALDVLRQEGAELIDPVDLSIPPELGPAELEVLRYEFKADLNAYLAKLGPGAPVHTLSDIIEFNESHRDQELRWFGQDEMTTSDAKGPLTDDAFVKALATCRRLARTEGIDAVMADDHLDAIVAPTSTPAHVTDWITGDHGLGDSTTMAAVAGYPSITVPAGLVFGLPVGISFFGLAWSEPKLLRMAFAFEQANQGRQPPQFLPALEG